MTIEEKENSLLSLYCDKEDIFDSCSHLVFNEVWSTDLNSWRYRIIKGLYEKGNKPDSLIVQNYLTKKGFNKKEITLSLVGTDYKILNNVGEYVKDVFNDYCRRILKPKLLYAYKDLDSEIADVEADIEDIKSCINDLEAIKHNVSKQKSVLQMHDEVFADLIKAQGKNDELVGYSTGLTELDKITGGLKQEVILVIAPPGAGKSTLMVNIIKHVALKQKAPVLIHSLEMPFHQLIKNIWGSQLEINTHGIRSAKLSDDNLNKIRLFRSQLENKNLIIDDNPSVTWQYIETNVRKMRKKIPLDKTIVVVIDYIQLVKNIPEEFKGTNSEERLSLIANQLMEISKRYNLCMIELSQMGRDKANPKKRPSMSDAKGSGALEANAVQVWGLYRADYFEKDPIDTNGMSLKGIAEIDVLKNRYGETRHFYAKFLGHYSSLEDYTPPEDAF